MLGVLARFFMVQIMPVQEALNLFMGMNSATG